MSLMVRKDVVMVVVTGIVMLLVGVFVDGLGGDDGGGDGGLIVVVMLMVVVMVVMVVMVIL